MGSLLCRTILMGGTIRRGGERRDLVGGDTGGAAPFLVLTRDPFAFGSGPSLSPPAPVPFEGS
jgi:hypothetical protein